MKEVYIVSVARTPIGAFGGHLSPLTAVQLGSIVIKEAVQRAGIQPDQIEEVIMGNVLQANNGQAPARQAALAAGLPNEVPCTTINKVCASGMKAIMLGAQTIKAGDNDIVLCGGMESMSHAPYYVTTARWGGKYGNSEFVDGIVRDGLQDPYGGHMMGNSGEICATGCNISREEQDAFAIESYKRATAARDNGHYDQEIVPVEIPQRKGDPIVISTDEEIDRVRYDKIPTLRPAFDKNGTITAANASKLNDGAAAVVLMSKEKADELGITPLAKVVSYADAAQEPDWFTTTPAKAMPMALEKAGKSFDDIDLFEINEAFAVVTIANSKELKLDTDKVNVYGGAVSLGHPIGVSGARIVITLLSALRNQDKQLGLAGICNGGGGASAMLIEKV